MDKHFKQTALDVLIKTNWWFWKARC